MDSSDAKTKTPDAKKVEVEKFDLESSQDD